jgi:hypothetical protein
MEGRMVGKKKPARRRRPNKEVVMALRVTQAEADQIDQACVQLELFRSEFLREAVRDKIKRIGKEAPNEQH